MIKFLVRQTLKCDFIIMYLLCTYLFTYSFNFVCFLIVEWSKLRSVNSDPLLDSVTRLFTPIFPLNGPALKRSSHEIFETFFESNPLRRLIINYSIPHTINVSVK